MASPSDDSHDSQRPPLTFKERNFFLIAGLIVVGVLGAILVIGWVNFHESRKERDIAGSMGEAKQVVKTAETGQEDRLNSLPSNSLLRIPTAQPTAPPPAKDTLSGEDLPFEIREQEIKNGDALMSKFWNAHTWAEKASFVHDSVRVEPLLQRHYETERQTDIPHGSLKNVAFYRMGGGLIQHRVYGRKEGAQVIELAMRRQASGSYLLDWESYVGASEQSWDEFMRLKPTDATLFRVYASLGDYYNYGYDDSNRYVSIRLTSPNQEKTIYGYCERNGPIARDFAGVINNRSLVPLTVKLSFRPGATSSECVNLDALVATRWLLP